VTCLWVMISPAGKENFGTHELHASAQKIGDLLQAGAVIKRYFTLPPKTAGDCPVPGQQTMTRADTREPVLPDASRRGSHEEITTTRERLCANALPASVPFHRMGRPTHPRRSAPESRH
jgi:hypothetical protein